MPKFCYEKPKTIKLKNSDNLLLKISAMEKIQRMNHLPRVISDGKLFIKANSEDDFFKIKQPYPMILVPVKRSLQLFKSQKNHIGFKEKWNCFWRQAKLILNTKATLKCRVICQNFVTKSQKQLSSRTRFNFYSKYLERKSLRKWILYQEFYPIASKETVRCTPTKT